MAEQYDQITIQGQLFRVPIRYKAGDVLKENEAGALNQTLHENLRNNFASKVKEAGEAGVGIEVLQQQLDDYAADYEFGVRGGGGPRGDPVLSLAMNVAREWVRRLVKERDLNQEEWGAARVTQAARALIERQGPNGTLMTGAREQIEKERKAAEDAMKEVAEVLAQAAQ